MAHPAVKYAKYALIVIVVFVFIAALSKWTGPSADAPSDAKFSGKMKRLVKEAARWSTVSEQDSNPMMRMLHSTYAVAYVNVARMMADDKDIEKMAHVRIDELTSQVRKRQQQAVQAIGTHCPSVVPEGQYALYTGWL